MKLSALYYKLAVILVPIFLLLTRKLLQPEPSDFEENLIYCRESKNIRHAFFLSGQISLWRVKNYILFGFFLHFSHVYSKETKCKFYIKRNVFERRVEYYIIHLSECANIHVIPSEQTWKKCQTRKGGPFMTPHLNP